MGNVSLMQLQTTCLDMTQGALTRSQNKNGWESLVKVKSHL